MQRFQLAYPKHLALTLLPSDYQDLTLLLSRTTTDEYLWYPPFEIAKVPGSSHYQATSISEMKIPNDEQELIWSKFEPNIKKEIGPQSTAVVNEPEDPRVIISLLSTTFPTANTSASMITLVKTKMKMNYLLMVVDVFSRNSYDRKKVIHAKSWTHQWQQSNGA